MSTDTRTRHNTFAPHGPGGLDCPCCRAVYRSSGASSADARRRFRTALRRLARSRTRRLVLLDLSRNPS